MIRTVCGAVSIRVSRHASTDVCLDGEENSVLEVMMAVRDHQGLDHSI